MVKKLNEKMNVVEMQHVYCKIGKKTLLQDISWNVRMGEHWLIYGENGSGKTTLLSLIAGYGMLYSGNLEVLGFEYNRENFFELRKSIGWVSTSFFNKIYKNESVADIMLSALSGSLGIRFDISLEDVKKARDELERFNLNDKFDSLYCMLSKGEQQKILLARALLQKPKLLLLDEPLSGLDIVSEKYVRSLLQKIVKDGQVTIICVGHHPEDFFDIVQYALHLNKGKRVDKI